MWTMKKMNSSKTAMHFDTFRDQYIIFECPDPIGEIVYAKWNLPVLMQYRCKYPQIKRKIDVNLKIFNDILDFKNII